MLDSADVTTVDAVPSIEAIEAATYYFFKHHGWCSRRVEKWFYDSDAQWTHKITLDVLINEEHIKVYRDASEGSVTPDDAARNNTLSIMVPLFAVPKGGTFSSLDIRDGGKSLKAINGTKCAHLIVSALVGGVAEETHNKCLLSKETGLRSVLIELLRQDFPLRDGDGRPILPYNPNRANLVRESAYRSIKLFIKSKGILRDLGWNEEDLKTLDGVDELFLRLYDNIPVFRWFIMRYTYYDLYCACITNTDTILKCSYQSSIDLFKRGGLHHRYSPFCYFGAPLDGVETADESCMTIFAPEGMQFVPNFYPHLDSARGTWCKEYKAARNAWSPKKMLRQFNRRWLTIIDTSTASEERGLNGVGSLSTSVASIKCARLRWGHEDGNPTPPRRVVTEDGQKDRNYVLELMLVPKLGARTVCYAVVMVLCCALFLMPLLAAGGVGSFVVPAITNLLPLGTMLISTMDGSRYMRRETLKLPKHLAILCTVLSVILLMSYMLIAEHKQAADAAGASDTVGLMAMAGTAVLVVGLAITLIALAVFALWLIHVWRVTRSWEKQEEYYGSFDIAQRGLSKR